MDIYDEMNKKISELELEIKNLKIRLEVAEAMALYQANKMLHIKRIAMGIATEYQGDKT